jgi:hypothetical protein
MAPVTPVTPCYAYRNSRDRPPAKGFQPLVTLLHLFPDTYTYKELRGYGVNGVCLYRGGLSLGSVTNAKTVTNPVIPADLSVTAPVTGVTLSL